MDLKYNIVRSPRRRKLTITVERDRAVVVHAPAATSEEKIHQVVEAKRQWIFEKTRHAQKYHDLPHPPGKELVGGESALYTGRNYRIEFVETESTEIRLERRFFVPVNLANRKFETFLLVHCSCRGEDIAARVITPASSVSSLHKLESWTTATAGAPARPTATSPSTGG